MFLQNTFQKCRSCRAQMFFKIGVLNSYAWRSASLLKKKLQHMCFQGRSHWGRQGVIAPSPLPLQFWNQTRSNYLSFKYQGYCFLCVFRNYTDEKFQNATSSGKFTASFHFCQLHRGNRSLHVGPSEKVQ